MTTEQNDRTEPPPSASRWTAGRVTGMVFASLAALVGVCLLLGGVAVIVVHGVARDDEGFYTSDKELLRSGGYAITTDRIAIDPGVADDLPEGLLETLRVRAESTGEKPVFLGIGPSAEVERYLDGVARARFVDFRGNRAVLEEIPGGAPRSAPDSRELLGGDGRGRGRAADRLGSRRGRLDGRGAERRRLAWRRGRGRHRGEGRRG